MNSMTGYARVEKSESGIQVTVEIKSVNHRYFDCQIKMPKELNELEIEMKRELKKKCQRGRVECYINISQETGDTAKLQVNWQALEALAADLVSRVEAINISPESFLSGGVMHPGLVEVVEKQQDEELLHRLVMATFNESVQRLEDSRAKEGMALMPVFDQQLSLIESGIKQITSLTTDYQKQHQDRLAKKLSELLATHEIDESRLLTEVALLVERGDISEELDRLAVHVASVQSLIHKSIPVGKEIDFIIQEMNREVNTIGSKSSLMAIKEVVVSLKLCIEQMREQVQNIE